MQHIGALSIVSLHISCSVKMHDFPHFQVALALIAAFSPMMIIICLIGAQDIFVHKLIFATFNSIKSSEMNYEHNNNNKCNESIEMKENDLQTFSRIKNEKKKTFTNKHILVVAFHFCAQSLSRTLRTNRPFIGSGSCFVFLSSSTFSSTSYFSICRCVLWSCNIAIIVCIQ